MISVGFKTDRGRLRDTNEDSVFVLPEQQIYVVADGVGGHNSGEVASRTAVEIIARYAESHPISENITPRALKQYFMDCLTEANNAIFEMSLSSEQHYGMATTCVLCYIRRDQAYVVNVGDSRAYLVRDGVMRQVTEDHSKVSEMVRSGLISEAEAQTRPDRNMITRALGGEPAVFPDFFQFQLYPGDTVMLCSDGLYGELEHSRMADLCTRYKTMHRLTKQLVDDANARGGKDNISVICIRIQ